MFLCLEIATTVLEDLVFPAHWETQLDRCLLEADGIRMDIHSTPAKRACPQCRGAAGRVHSQYIRHAADVPLAGYRVRMHVRVRRFFCDNPACPRRTFVEQVPDFLAPHARRTLRHDALLGDIAFAVGGKPGARLAAKHGMKVSRDTLLRIIRATPVPVHATPRVLGVDDWSYRKGVTYGTILIDLARHCPIDVRVDRTADTFARWLEAHPGVETISRDRASAYADGARRGAPDALQVADRFHILKNLGDHLKTLFERKNACLLTPQSGTVSQELAPHPTAEADNDTPVEHAVAGTAGGVVGEERHREAPALPEATAGRAAAGFQSRKHYLFAHIQALAQAGFTQRGIARDLGISRQTVKKYAQATDTPRYTPRPPRASKLDLYKPYLHARWHAGMYKSVTLFLEIKERGYTGSWALVGQYLQHYQIDHPRVRPVKAERGRPPDQAAHRSPRRARRLLRRRSQCSVRAKPWG